MSKIIITAEDRQRFGQLVGMAIGRHASDLHVDADINWASCSIPDIQLARLKVEANEAGFQEENLRSPHLDNS